MRKLRSEGVREPVLSWDFLGRIGTRSPLCHIDGWLMESGADGDVLQILTDPSCSLNPLTMWRILFLGRLYGWSFAQCHSATADSLAARCFTRLAITHRPPAAATLQAFTDRNADEMEAVWHHLVGLWVREVQDSRRTRAEWRRVMDGLVARLGAQAAASD